MTKEHLNQVESILENMIDFLRDVGHQFSADSSITRGKKSSPEDSPGLPMDLDSFDPGFVQVRPSREGRRYLLWRKITGWFLPCSLQCSRPMSSRLNEVMEQWTRFQFCLLLNYFVWFVLTSIARTTLTKFFLVFHNSNFIACVILRRNQYHSDPSTNCKRTCVHVLTVQFISSNTDKDGERQICIFGPMFIFE